MQSLPIKLKALSLQRVECWVYAFIVLHVIVWTLAPTWVRHTLPMDAMEGTTWGSQLEWGYDKNPFMNGWLSALAVYIGGKSGWAIYLFSQLSVALCFWALWQLGKKMLPPLYALLAVFLLEGIQYYNIHAIDFDDNVLELGLWALTILFFYQALLKQKYLDWILTGFFAGLSMMTKYYAAMLLLPMLLFMIVTPSTYGEFKKLRFYLGLSVFFIIIAPHTAWLFSHDFVTIDYALRRVSSSEPSWLNHFYYPAQFFWQQIQVFLPALFLLLLLIVRSPKAEEIHKNKDAIQFDTLFLLMVGIGPFLLTILLSACTGIKLRAGWGQPLLTFWGLFFLKIFLPKLTSTRLKWFFSIFIFIFIGTVIIYCVALLRADEPSSANFPGRPIASSLEKEWHNHYHRPFAYVVGARWIAGTIAFYSHDRPRVYIDANKKFSPWIDEKKLKQAGALFVWDPTEEHQMSVAEIKKRFPQLGPLKILHFPWMRNKTMTPVEISIAFLAPEGH